MTKKEKIEYLFLFNNLMYSDRKIIVKAFVLMAKKHYKNWGKMILKFFCLAMQTNNCKLCSNNVNQNPK